METIRDKIFYSVIGFKNAKGNATFSKDGYIKKGNAQRIAKNLIIKGYDHVILRLEEVWLRNESNEFSASTPIEEYTINGVKQLSNKIV